MKTFFLLLLLFCSVVASGQVAIIKDKDRYTNVREKPNGQSDIIHKIYENEVFWFDYKEGVDSLEWVLVYIPKNDFSLGSFQAEYVAGFIHISRLEPLAKLPLYTGTGFSFEYIIQPFDSTNRIIDKIDGKWIAAIDGRPVWGTDGEFPRTQVKEVKVVIEGQEISVSKAFYSDIYECTNSFEIYKNDDAYLVYQWNSDGAGFYEVVWVFTKEGLQQRLVGTRL